MPPVMDQPEIVKLWIRIPAEIKRSVEDQAKHNCRSLTAEITWILRTSIDQRQQEQRAVR